MTRASAIRRHRKARLASFLLCLPGLVVAAVSFPEIRTVVDISADGSAHMVQGLTGRFDGRISWVRLVYPRMYRDCQVTLNRCTEQSRLGSVPVEDVKT